MPLRLPPSCFLAKATAAARLRPVAGRDREDVGIALAVGGRGRAEARRGAEDLVLLELLGQRRGLRRAVEALEHRAFLLEALVRLHGRRHLVLVVDLEHADLVALDAALAVHERDVVVIAGAEEHADGLRGAGAVALQAEHELLLLRDGGACRQAPVRPPPTAMRSQLRCFRHCVSSFAASLPVTQYENGQIRK